MTPRAMDTTEKPVPKPVMDVMPPHPHELPKTLAPKPVAPPPSPRAASIATPPDNVKLAPSHATAAPVGSPAPKLAEPSQAATIPQAPAKPSLNPDVKAVPVPIHPPEPLATAGRAGAPVAPPPDSEHSSDQKSSPEAQDTSAMPDLKLSQPKKVPQDSPIGAIIITVLIMIALSALAVLVYLNS